MEESFAENQKHQRATKQPINSKLFQRQIASFSIQIYCKAKQYANILHNVLTICVQHTMTVTG